jgi:outer membrane protein OmpA-like peptidoglycan-associated protein
MTHYQAARLSSGITLISVILLTVVAAAQTKVEGFISEKSGSTITLQMPDATTITVLITDTTRVAQREGLVRKKTMSRAVLVTGLQITVEGTENDQNQLVANSVTYSKDDLEKARAIQAGVSTTKAQAKQHEAELQRQNAELQAQNARLEAEAAKVAANKTAIEEAHRRFGQLGEFSILDELTIFYGNSKTAIDPKYESQLLALCEKAKSVKGYRIQVKGYASASGSVAVNQKLSHQRAEKVTNFVLQQGHIPLVNMLTAGAMGESQQVANSDKAGASEAENRRVVVRILQNKGIAGT